jgi:hypothetical protein
MEGYLLKALDRLKKELPKRLRDLREKCEATIGWSIESSDETILIATFVE